MNNEEIKVYIGKAIYHIDEAISALGGLEDGFDPVLETLSNLNSILEDKWEEYERT